ncbi:hypothetical protein YTPLAS72_10560 [Nitrospira sp.]|nr:hypothetical protein YTPLAS72_10560 [Nitrospira sp.]
MGRHSHGTIASLGYMMSQGPWDIALGSEGELVGIRTRMVRRLFQSNHGHAEDIIGVVYLGAHAMGKGLV